MGRRKPRTKQSLKIVHPSGRHYECRDCPARCCTSSWGIPVTAEERDRILADDEARSRLTSRAEAILRAGVLPMTERGESLACVFLDDDMLCSLHRRHGHSFIPAPCQAYPFGFTQNEHGQPVALLSRYCPSIRDNYGEPVEEVLSEKLGQAGGALPMSEKMGLKSGRVLPRSQYVQLLGAWAEMLAEAPSASDALARLYDFTDSFDGALPARRPDDQEVQALLVEARDQAPALLPAGTGLGFNGRVLLSHLLGGICYPSRVMLAHRVRPVSFSEKLRSWGNRLAWLFGFGKVKLLFVARPVPVRRALRTSGFLRGELGELLLDYLRELLLRRQGFSKQTYLSRVLVDWALMTVVASRYARAASAAAGRPVMAGDVKEGIGVAELLFSHQSDAGQSAVLQGLRLKLMSSPDEFRRLLAAEV